MSKQKKKITCSNCDCKNELYMAGFCEKHYKEYEFKTERRETAIRTLHRGTIEDCLPVDKNLLKELERLCEWWSRVGTVLNNNRGTELMPLDEAKDAKEWCIILAQNLIDAEQAFRSGKKTENSFDLNSERLWNRFKNLEKGLASNGVKRKIKK